jgi:hypothetical protein
VIITLIFVVGFRLGFGFYSVPALDDEQLNDVIDELLCLGLANFGQLLACAGWPVPEASNP